MKAPNYNIVIDAHAAYIKLGVAAPETLRSPATGMTDASETPSPPPAGATRTRRRKKRPPTMEMEDPPLF